MDSVICCAYNLSLHVSCECMLLLYVYHKDEGFL